MALPPLSEHLLRRAGFGVGAGGSDAVQPASPTWRSSNARQLRSGADGHRSHIGTPGYVGITTRGAFSPNTVINDARQRWLFRHGAFAGAAAGEDGALLAPPLRDGVQQDRGHRRRDRWRADDGGEAVGGSRRRARADRAVPRSTRSATSAICCVEVAKDPAMLVWLDGRLNTKAQAAGELRPRADGALHVRRRATTSRPTSTRRRASSPAGTSTTIGDRGTASAYYAFNYNAGAARHDREGLQLSDLSPTAARRIPARSAAAGMQDGLDLIDALAVHPETAQRLARKLWTWFVERDRRRPTTASSTSIANVYLQSDTEHEGRSCARCSLSPQFRIARTSISATRGRRSSSCASLKEVGYRRLLGERRADAAWSTWGSSCSSRRTSTAGSSGPGGSRPAACWRG